MHFKEDRCENYRAGVNIWLQMEVELHYCNHAADHNGLPTSLTDFLVLATSSAA